MEFYVLDEIEEGTFKSTGIGVNAMVKVLDSIEKAKYAQTIDELEPYNIVYLESAKFIENTDVVFTGKIKKEEFALIKNGKTFEVNQLDQHYFVRLGNGKLNIAQSLEKLEQYCLNKDMDNYSPTEKKAYDWLENGKTGLSSLVVLHTLLPNIKHSKTEQLESGKNSSYPHDTSDFNRCLGLFNHVPELKQDLSKLRTVNTQWRNLVDKWEAIIDFMDNNQLDEANTLINQCVNPSKAKKM